MISLNTSVVSARRGTTARKDSSQRDDNFFINLQVARANRTGGAAAPPYRNEGDPHPVRWPFLLRNVRIVTASWHKSQKEMCGLRSSKSQVPSSKKAPNPKLQQTICALLL